MSRSEFESRPIPSYLREPIKVSSGVHTVIGEEGPHCDTANGIIIGEKKIFAFIDVGSEDAQPYTLRNALATGLPFAETVFFLYSHLHVDHYGGHEKMKAAVGKLGVKTRTLIPEGNETSDTKAALYGKDSPRLKSDGVIETGQTLYFGDTEVTPYKASGHDPNQLSFAISDRDGIVLFAADTMGLLFPSADRSIQRQLDEQNYSIDIASSIQFQTAVRGHDNPRAPISRTVWDQFTANFAKKKTDLRPGKGYIGQYGWNQQYYPVSNSV